jgi:hypothetical protein
LAALATALHYSSSFGISSTTSNGCGYATAAAYSSVVYIATFV